MLKQYHCLYVEDDHLSREVMQMIMKSVMGVAKLTILEDSSHFMTRLKSLDCKPEIILLDVHMKPHNGFEMLEMLRADVEYAKTTVIALTASVMNEEVEKLRQSGFDGAIAKPLSVKTFPALMARVIDGETVWHVA